MIGGEWKRAGGDRQTPRLVRFRAVSPGPRRLVGCWRSSLRENSIRGAHVPTSVGFESINVKLARNRRRAVNPAGIVTAGSYVDLPVRNGRDGEFDRIARRV